MCKEKSYYYNHLGDRELVGTDDIWLPILKYGIRTATHFEAHFPDDDSYLAEGKEEVRELPQISVMPWSGMKGAIAVHGAGGQGAVSEGCRRAKAQALVLCSVPEWENAARGVGSS